MTSAPATSWCACRVPSPILLWWADRSLEMAAKRTKRTTADAGTEAILRHWREAVPNDRFAHLVKDATRGLLRAMQMRLARHGVSFGHWAFLRILWESD